MNSDFEYVVNYYGVPACKGRIVDINGKRGVIVKDLGHHIGVVFDGDKPSQISHCHPTWRVTYLGLGKVPKMSRSQQRYQRYLEFGDSFESFIDFCRWDSDGERSWNKN